MHTLTPVSPSVKYFEDLEVGNSWQSEGRTVTETDVVTFATWSGDMHPLHTNAEYAKSTQFGERIFHGPGALALAFGLEMRIGWKMGSAVAFLGVSDWRMSSPIFIGDTITVREEVVDLRASASNPDRGIVRTRVEIVNQQGQTCHHGEWAVLLFKNAAAALTPQ
ncbi:MaoC/PaaZ C-terminal domain-containing protein [Brevibacterium sp.]|uniref:MaoC/PaaZ C-terminal domain-containing protein n=1 Tax=Brevibacterium sp. TaxID=1701 RepID=UPI0028126254|nr:MaoC/PaaZ C-terminal domain-containing protein [Brevibacterium sp.]